jgi:AcrR family transcriptional regulator
MVKVKQFHHGDLKRALLDAALELLDEQGASGVGIRAVARKVGVSHAAPVNHFQDRRALLTGMAIKLFDDIQTIISGRLEGVSNDPATRIECVVKSFFEYGAKHPNRYALLWRNDVVDHECDEMRIREDEVYNLVCGEIDKLIAGRNIDTDTVAIGLWSMMHGYIDLKIVGMFEERVDRVTGEERSEALIKMFRTIFDQYGL